MGALTTMTAKGQITIPSDVRDALGLHPGTQFHVSAHEGQIVVVPKNRKLADLAGILGKPPSGKGFTLEEIDDAIMEAVDRDHDRVTREWRGKHK